VHAEAAAPDGARGVFDAGPPTCAPLSCAKLVMRNGAEGAFTARPPACIPNKSQDQFPSCTCHAYEIISFGKFSSVMTYANTNDFPHHSYTRISQPIMPDLECINILENHVVCNMWNGFYVCVVQSIR
jgi:hypothetical protein